MPPTVPEGDDRVAVLAAYIRSDGGRHTDEALRRAVSEAGYTDAEFVAAQALASPTWQTPDAGSGPKYSRAVVIGVATAYVLILYVAIAIAAGTSGDASGTVAIGGLLLGVVVWAFLRNERPSLARGFGCGVVMAIVIPIVAVLVILGICIATGSYPTA
jgi:hypothetical protein